MATDLTVDADLEFSVDIPGSRTVTGSLTGSGKTLELRVSDPSVFAGRSDSARDPWPRQDARRAEGCRSAWSRRPDRWSRWASRRTSWLQRRLTGSPHIRIERGAGLWSLVRGRARSPRGGALPATALAPPPTSVPDRPHHGRRPRRPGDHDARPGPGREPAAHPAARAPTRGRAIARRSSRCATTSPPSARSRLRHPIARTRAAARRDPARRRGRVRAGRGSAARAETRVHGAPVRQRDPAYRVGARSR